MFNNMSYKEYQRWCEERRVIPASLESFLETKEKLIPIETTPDIPEIEDSKSQILSAKDLKKLRKSSLVELCKENNINLIGNETKNSLIRTLLSVNK